VAPPWLRARQRGRRAGRDGAVPARPRRQPHSPQCRGCHAGLQATLPLPAAEDTLWVLSRRHAGVLARRTRVLTRRHRGARSRVSGGTFAEPGLRLPGIATMLWPWPCTGEGPPEAFGVCAVYARRRQQRCRSPTCRTSATYSGPWRWPARSFLRSMARRSRQRRRRCRTRGAEQLPRAGGYGHGLRGCRGRRFPVLDSA
jgi:hypothetical protein